MARVAPPAIWVIAALVGVAVVATVGAALVVVVYARGAMRAAQLARDEAARAVVEVWAHELADADRCELAEGRAAQRHREALGLASSPPPALH